MTKSAEYVATWRAKTKAWALAYLGGSCVSCGTDERLDFDHVDPRTKVSEISVAIAACWSRQRLLVELDKCQLLCRPCHIDKSAANLDGRIVAHGGGASGKKNCKCIPCKTRKAAYMAGYKRRKKQARLAQ